MDKIISFFSNNTLALIIFYIVVIVLIIFTVLKIKGTLYGTFGEAKFYRYLKRLYNKYDYPYIKEIILPINKETCLYYDAIVFGNKYFYIIEVKNHHGELRIDPLDDWFYINKNNSYPFINAFYELDLKTHVLNRFLEINRTRIVPLTVYSSKTKIIGSKGSNHLIQFNQVASFIRQYEANSNISSFTPSFIENKGNYLLDINIKKYNARKKTIDDIKASHIKR